MKRNFFDSWNVIFDSHNKPLLGKLEFYEVETTSLKTIYDVDGNELLNPIYVNGRPDTQIMLGEGDYSVKFFEYIGHGDMRNDEEYSNWHDYKTIILRDDSTSADVMLDVNSVVTINDLKNLKNMQDGDVVQVIGYFTKEDCPARLYVWHSENGRDDDGGVIIKSNETTVGYWEMKIPGSYIDVRWYGDIPSNFASASSSNLSQRTKAAAAANYYKKDLYFPSYGKGNALGFYMFSGSNTVAVTKDIICDNGVRFVVKTGTTGTKVQCHELYKCDKYLFISQSASVAIGGYTLEANWIRTSWLNSGDTTASGARVGYVIDYLNSDLDFENTKIKFERDGLNKDNVAFRHCEFVDCYKNIDRPTIFDDMEIKQSWFADSFDITRCSFSKTCNVRLDNFDDADTYVKVKNKQGLHDYGDLNEGTLNNATIYLGTASDPAILENFSGEISFLASSSGYIEMHNASVKINNLNDKKNLNLVDCWITLPATSECKSLSIRRGSIMGTGTFTVKENCYLNDVSVDVPMQAQGTTTVVENSELNKAFACFEGKFYNNKIYDIVNTVAKNYTISFEMIGNTFMQNGAYHKIAGYVNTDGEGGVPIYTVVNGRWEHNKALFDTHHWIVVDREYLVRGDSFHNYYYMNNSEPFIKKSNNKVWEVLGGNCNYTTRENCTNTESMVLLNTKVGEVSLAVGKTNANPFVFHRFSLMGGHAIGSVELLWDYQYGFAETDDRDHESHVAVTRIHTLYVYNWGYSYYGTDSKYHYDAGNGMDEYKAAFSPKSTDIMNFDTQTSKYYTDGQTIGVFALRWKYGDYSESQYLPGLFRWGTSSAQRTNMRIRNHSDISTYA